MPVFVLDDALRDGRFASTPRETFMLGCRRALDDALRGRGSGLVIRHGDPAEELVALAHEVGAQAVLWTSDVSPYARSRDARVTCALREAGIEAQPQGGNYIVDVSKPRTQGGRAVDWRAAERHFEALLLDGEPAQNNGNWQWVTSVGVDPAPYFRRIFNPVLQQQKFDPPDEYVRRWVPELRGVPDEHLAEPWKMSEKEQAAAGCVIGRDYPAPIVDHAEERRRAIDRYRSIG